MKLFGTDGIRGQVGDFLTAPLALQVGYWAGQVLISSSSSARAIAIGQDSRNSGDMLTAALTAGLTAAGLDVWNLGICPTPTVAYLSATMPELLGGIMVSASHNPPADNGIKFFDDRGIKLSQDIQAQIESLITRSLPSPAQPEIQIWGKCYGRSPLIQSYQTAIQNSISQDLQGLKIVLDLAWGAAAKIAPDVFRQLGAEVTCLHDQPDGDRINVNCGSTYLGTLCQAVKTHQADLGFAFDGDADRVLAVDALGHEVNGDYILYLWGQELLEIQKLPQATIISTVMANLGFEKAWNKLGGKLVRTAVGDQYVHAEMLKSGAMLGGEQSGHVLCRHYGESGDGLLTAIHLAALVKQKAPLFELMQASFTPFPQLLKNVRVESKELRSQWNSCLPLTQAIEKAEADLGDRGRVLVRASGTEPLMRVMVEAEESAIAEHWTNLLVNTITNHLVDS